LCGHNRSRRNTGTADGQISAAAKLALHIGTPGSRARKPG
jgi:hypothetical protein